jgi:hypothetical protein
MEGDERLSRTSAMKCADAGDGDARDLTRNACVRGCREEELVVLASMEGGVKRLFRRERMRKRVKGDRTGVDLGADARGFAEVSEVGGEAVAEIDGGRGKAAAKKSRAYSKARLREEMRMVLRGGSARWAVCG